MNGVCVADLALHTFAGTRIQSHGGLLEEVPESHRVKEAIDG